MYHHTLYSMDIHKSAPIRAPPSAEHVARSAPICCPVGRPRCLVCAQPTTIAARPGRGPRTRAASITPHRIGSTPGTYFQYFIKNYILIGRYRDRRYLYLYYAIKQVGRRETVDIYEFIWRYSKFVIDTSKCWCYDRAIPRGTAQRENKAGKRRKG